MTVKICYHCDHDRYPKGKPLFDLAADSAVPDRRGGWKCSDCVRDSLNKEILRYAPNSPAARDIIAARKREEEFKARYKRMKKQPGQRLGCKGKLISNRGIKNITLIKNRSSRNVT